MKIVQMICALFMGLLLSSVSIAETPKNALVMANTIDDIISLDPAEIFEFSGAEYAGNVYDRLIGFDVDDVSKIYGVAAESWEISEDGKTFTFKVRPGIQFASGNEMTADDVVFSLQRLILLDKSPAFILGQFGLTADNVKDKIKKVDDMTLSMELDRAYAPTFVLYCLTATVGSVVDMKEVMANEKDGDYGYEWLKTNYAGSGPFMLNSWKPNESLSYKANENYWNGAPEMKSVFVRHVPESSVQRLLLEKGDVDIARNLEADQLKGIADNQDIKIQSKPKGAIYYLGLNQKNEYLSNPKVIEALKYLVNYKGIEDTFISGRGVIHQSFLPKGFLGAIDDQPFSLDIDKAKALLAEAGLADGFKVSMDTRNTTLITDMAKSLQTTWAKAGIELEIIPGDGKQTLTKYRARTHDIYIGRWGPDYQDPHTNADTFASNPDNSDDASAKTLAWRNAWDIPQMTETTQQAILESDSATRAKMYQDLQREHQKVAPFVIMYQEIENAAMRVNVNGFILGPSFDSNFYNQTVKQ